MIYALFYTCNRFDGSAFDVAVKQSILESLRPCNIKIISSSQKKIDFGVNIMSNPAQGQSSRNIAWQMMTWLEKLEYWDYVFCVEDDVLYNSTHFDLPLKYTSINFNTNCWRSTAFGYCKQHPEYIPMSQFSGPAGLLKQVLIDHINRVTRGIEPLPLHGFKDSIPYCSDIPNVDVRHGHNTTSYNPFFAEIRDELEYWGNNKDLREKLKIDRNFDDRYDVVYLGIHGMEEPRRHNSVLVASLMYYIINNRLDELKSILDCAGRIVFCGEKRTALGKLESMYHIE